VVLSRLGGNENGNKKDDEPALPVFFILKRKGLLAKAAIIECATRTTFWRTSGLIQG
jgi:hypothetical protein